MTNNKPLDDYMTTVCVKDVTERVGEKCCEILQTLLVSLKQRCLSKYCHMSTYTAEKFLDNSGFVRLDTLTFLSFTIS